MYRTGQRSWLPQSSVSSVKMITTFSTPPLRWSLFLLFHCERGEKGVWTGMSTSCWKKDETYSLSGFHPPTALLPLFLKKAHWHFKRNYYPRVKGRNTGETAFPNLHSPEGPADTGTPAIRAGTGADTDLGRHTALSRHLHKCELCLPNLASQLTCPAGGDFRHFPNILIAIGLTY